MRNLSFYFCIVLFSLSYTIFGQGQNNYWYFGNSAGIQFPNGQSTITPTVLTNGSPNSIIPKAAATISDANGNLLFYSLGPLIKNKNHQNLLNGNFVASQSSMGGTPYQSVLMVPHPGNENLYYYFLTRGEQVLCCQDNLPRLSYSIIDKTLDSNNGGVVVGSKDIPILTESGTPEAGLTVTTTASNDGYWVLSTKKTYFPSSLQLISIKIDNSGINTPVYSTIPGIAPSDYSFLGNYIKVSPNNQKLAIRYGGNIRVYTFDSQTGSISNPQLLSDSMYQFSSMEFSEDSNLLYVTNSTLKVFDLTNSFNSRDILAPNGAEIRGLQRAVNGEIFMINFSGNNDKLFVLDSQNSFLNSNINITPINLGVNRMAFSGLPQLMPSLNINAACEYDIVRTSTETISKLYKASNTILANTNFIVNSGINTTMKASNYILLENQCDIKPGSVFIAEIEKCDNNMKQETYVEMKGNDSRVLFQKTNLYPNPNNGSFTISLSSETKEEVVLEIYDIYGKLVYSSLQKGTTFDVNVSNLSAGMYLVKMLGDSYNETIKFMKK